MECEEKVRRGAIVPARFTWETTDTAIEVGMIIQCIDGKRRDFAMFEFDWEKGRHIPAQCKHCTERFETKEVSNLSQHTCTGGTTEAQYNLFPTEKQ